MEVAEIISFPTEEHLKKLLRQPQIDIVSPFHSGGTLKKLRKDRHKKIRLITRLPTVYHSPPASLDNDPRPLRDAMERLGNRLEVFALPEVHAKLYLGAKHSWLGSSNFTINGFSSKEEILLRFDGLPADLSSVFTSYKGKSEKIALAQMEKLVRWVKLGLTRTRPTIIKKTAPGQDVAADDPVTSAASYDDFKAWLAGGAGPKKYILDRINGKNAMSGHAYLDFNGTAAFLRNCLLYTSDAADE